jgi:hypothetical protein
VWGRTAIIFLLTTWINHRCALRKTVLRAVNTMHVRHRPCDIQVDCPYLVDMLSWLHLDTIMDEPTPPFQVSLSCQHTGYLLRIPAFLPPSFNAPSPPPSPTSWVRPLQVQEPQPPHHWPGTAHF